MGNLVLPSRVTIQLVDAGGSPLKIADVSFRVRAFARRKSDFYLQPFATDPEGMVAITKRELEAEVAANQDSGLMDYGHIGECLPVVEIRLLSEDEIRRALEARKVWKNLLAGERDRWNSMDQLLAQYRRANNGKLLIPESSPIRDEWTKDRAAYAYSFPASLR